MTVRFFGLFREGVGREVAELQVAEGSRLKEVVAQVARAWPGLPLDYSLFAVNGEYAELATVLKEGDEVAFLPPLSGGAYVELTQGALDPRPFADRVRDPACGAVVTFEGVVRSPSEGHQVLYLEYEAYALMAEHKLHEICDEVRARWGLEAAIGHRMGRLEVGEVSLVVAVAAPHRAAAFEACQYAIDRVKEVVPIWKKEVWEGGQAWVTESH